MKPIKTNKQKTKNSNNKKQAIRGCLEESRSVSTSQLDQKNPEGHTSVNRTTFDFLYARTRTAQPCLESSGKIQF